MVVVDRGFLPQLPLQDVPSAFHPVLEDIGNRHQLDVFVRSAGIHGSSVAAPATADQSDLQRVVGGSMNHPS